jgi:hypothetical protein
MLIVDPLNGSMYELPEKVILSKPNSWYYIKQELY